MLQRSPSLGPARALRRAPALPRLFAFLGPGYLVAVGYMDPGNWATDLAGGSQFGFALLSVIVLSSLLGMFLQSLAVRLGIATDRDLAAMCREHYSAPVRIGLYLTCEVAIIACDLAEVIGTAIALNLLFGIALVWGALITAIDTLLVLALTAKGMRWLEAFVVSLLIVTAACFAVELVIAAPRASALLSGALTLPRGGLYIAVGILGATVMPHNLYLHSSIVQTREFPRTFEGRKFAIRWAGADSAVALTLALFVNAAILILAASAFHAHGLTNVTDIAKAYRLLSPLLGFAFASILFAIALLASGFNSAITATLAGQIVMEGFLKLRLSGWARRLLTRGLAIAPVVAIAAIQGGRGTAALLLLSQVILAMQLPFAVVPLVRFVSDRTIMGPLALGRPAAIAAWAVCAAVVAADAGLLYSSVL